MVYIVGGGTKIDVYKEKIRRISNIKIKFTGSLNREELNRIYSISHVIVLPSFSEGFPKVIAEASAYRCVPIVSNVGSLSQYINGENGILLKNNLAVDLYNAIIYLKNNRSFLKKLSLECNKISKKFTYVRYLKSIKQIINKK
jgi:glycosyltransferase involved in cell wall biosynthesis